MAADLEDVAIKLESKNLLNSEEVRRFVDDKSCDATMASTKKKSFIEKYGPALKVLIPIRLFSRTKNVHPVDAAGLISTIGFSWMTTLVWKTFRKPPKVEDLWMMSEYDETQKNYQRISRLWEEEIKAKGPENASLWMVMLRFIRTRLIISTTILFLYSMALFFGSSVVVHNLLSYISEDNPTLQMGIGLIAALFFVDLARASFSALHLAINYRTAVRARAAILLLVFRKALKMSPSNGSTSIGELVTMCSNDGDRIFESNHFGNFMFMGPIVFLCGLVYTCFLLGPIGLVGPLLFISTIPLQGKMIKVLNKFRKKMIVNTEARTIKINEILSSIKLIKMYSWEDSFLKVVNELREKELSRIKVYSFLYSLVFSIAYVAPLVASVVMISLYVILGHELTPDIAFTSIAIFNAMAYGLKFSPMALKYVADVNVSLKRLQKFLISESLTEYVVTKTSVETNAIEIDEASFAWNLPLNAPDDTKENVNDQTSNKPDSEKLLETENCSSENKGPVLHNVNLSVQRGSLVGIFGSVGCGKSSLISGIMGQLQLVGGKVAVADSIAYVAQEAWLMNATIRENIIFGLKFDRKKYDDVIAACELTKDFEIILSGDMTEVGERGINLSGGQKQRISLARALYSDREIYLLDDPLSAVDAHVGKSIFFEVIISRLKNKGKTILLVTHQLQYLPHCDQVVKVENSTTTPVDSQDAWGTEDSVMESTDMANDKVSDDKIKSVTASSPIAGVSKQNEDAKTEEGKLMTKEERGDTVSLSTYFTYVRASGGMLAGFFMFLFFVVNVGIQQFSYFWLSYWLKQGSGRHQSNISQLSENITMIMTTTADMLHDQASDNILLNPDLYFYLVVYLSSILLMFLVSAIRGYMYVLMTVHASKVLHQTLFERVLHGTMAFFDTTPTGRIINRFQKDMDELDLAIPGTVEHVFLHVTSVAFTAGLIVYVFDKFIYALLVIFPLFIIVYIFFKPACRELKRLDVLTRSPWFSHMTATISGLDTIRIYEKSQTFIKKFCVLLDRNGEAYYLYKCTNRWLGIRLDLLTICITVVTTIFVVNDVGIVSPALAALALSSAMALSGLLQLTVRLLTEMEARFVCTDRIKYYIKNTDQETTASSVVPPENWPQKGEIEFKNVLMKYRDGLPYAVEDLSFKTKAFEKIGVVGRTGAGKSSLAVTLFRLVELSGGSIFIDGVDISKLSLHDLRSHLSIIPQGPVLFSGTVRYNLDPFNQYSDSDIWHALEQAHLKSSISNLPDQLESIVSENGGNFSVGERQLICLARALLRKSRVLILDEATAAVDRDTEKIVQDVIQQAFSKCTLITIAHRLSTVTSCDRVLVMDKGKVIEFDAPGTLLQDSDSAFAQMVTSSHSGMTTEV